MGLSCDPTDEWGQFKMSSKISGYFAIEKKKNSRYGV